MARKEGRRVEKLYDKRAGNIGRENGR